MQLGYESSVRGALRDGEVELWCHEERLKRVERGTRSLLVLFIPLAVICGIVWLCNIGVPAVVIGFGLSLVVVLAIGLLTLIDRFRSTSSRQYRLTNLRLLFLKNEQCTEMDYRQVQVLDTTRSLRDGSCTMTLDYQTIPQLPETRTLQHLICDGFVAAGRRPRCRTTRAKPTMTHADYLTPVPDWLDLLQGERLLWQGRPDGSLRGRFTWRRLTIAPALLFICGWILAVQFGWITNWLIGVKPAPALTWIAGVVLFFTLVSINGWVQEFRSQRKMHYALTNIRAITMTRTRSSVNTHSLFLDMVANLTTSETTGHTDEVSVSAQDADELEDTGEVRLARISFTRIQNPGKVNRLVLEAIRDLGKR
jgi:hypothetical protein